MGPEMPSPVALGPMANHRLGVLAFGYELHQHPRPDPRAAPADPSVEEGLGRAVVGRPIPPAQPVAVHGDAARHPPIVHPRSIMRPGKAGAQPLHPRPGQPEQVAHAAPPSTPRLNQPAASLTSGSMGPDLRSGTGAWLGRGLSPKPRRSPDRAAWSPARPNRARRGRRRASRGARRGCARVAAGGAVDHRHDLGHRGAGAAASVVAAAALGREGGRAEGREVAGGWSSGTGSAEGMPYTGGLKL